MKKVAINTCYGGFSISPLAVKRLAELQGRSCYFFKFEYGKEYAPMTLEEAIEVSLFWCAYDIPSPSEVLNRPDAKKWREMSQEEREASNKLHRSHELTNRPENREDPLLIQVIKELGKKANGRCAQLKVVRIPDGVDYEIDEYDGLESIHEVHRSWS